MRKNEKKMLILTRPSPHSSVRRKESASPRNNCHNGSSFGPISEHEQQAANLGLCTQSTSPWNWKIFDKSSIFHNIKASHQEYRIFTSESFLIEIFLICCFNTQQLCNQSVLKIKDMDD